MALTTEMEQAILPGLITSETNGETEGETVSVSTAEKEKEGHILPIKAVIYFPNKPQIGWIVSKKNSSGISCEKTGITNGNLCQILLNKKCVFYRDNRYKTVRADTTVLVHKKNLIKN